MAARVSKFVPSAAQAAPEAQVREQSLRTLERELQASEDDTQAALLHFEIARLHELRDDLSSAARQQLSATRKAPDYVEAIEALIDISIRSRSRANLQKLLERLNRLSQSEDEKIRAGLGLALVHVASDEFILARDILLDLLDELPSNSTLWLALEGAAGSLGDRPLLLKAALGRAAHVNSPRLRSLLLERVARLHFSANAPDEAYAVLRQSVDEAPSYRAVHTWEQLALRAHNDAEAGLAATRLLELLKQANNDPELAERWEVPAEELLDERVQATKLRRIIYALRRKAPSEARQLAAELAEESPSSPLNHAVQLELSRKDKKEDELLESVVRLQSAHEWSEEDRMFLLGVAALAHSQNGNVQTASALFEQMAENRPSLNLPRVAAWIEAESSSDPEALRVHIDKLANENHSEEDFSLASAVLDLLNGNGNAALEKLGEELTKGSSSMALIASALRRLSAQNTGNDSLLLLETVFLSDELPSESDRAALSWELLRNKLAHGEIPEGRDQLDEWTTFLLPLLKGAGTAGGCNEELRVAAKPLLDGEERLKRSLLCLNLARDADERLLSRLWEEDQTDPFVSAAYLAHLERSSSGKLDAVRDESAKSSEDLLLKAIWSLRAAFSHLTNSNDELALAALDVAGEVVEPLRRTLAPWFKYRKLKGDPGETLHLLEGNESLRVERHLDYIALIQRLRPDEEFEWSNEPTPAEQLLRALTYTVEEPKKLSEVLSGIEFFDAGQKAALALGGMEGASESERLSTLRTLRKTGPTPSKWIAEWTAAERAGDATATSSAILGLGREIDSQSLLASLGPDDIPETEHAQRVERLRSQLDSSGQGAQEKGELDPTCKTPSDSRDLNEQHSLLWSIFESSSDDFSEQHASELLQLAELLDPDLSDADAQTAQLLAGYELLSLSQFEEALNVFVPLRALIPDDLTLAQGVRLAAQRAFRPDLEAEVSCELARHAPDNQSSADLWERAGVLYQEFLSSPEKAEDCFSAALTRSPGRPLAFERLYRFARSRNDRARQVELIDARLETAESNKLKIELQWEKARFCRMLGRRTIAVRALTSLLELSPNHLPALALTAELHLVDSRLEPAAEALKRVAKHPEAPPAERASAGLYACDLFEKLGRPRDTIELLQDLEHLGFKGSGSLERSARALARSEDWGEAYKAFSMLNDRQDDIAVRLESARMMLAIQRDHLIDSEEIKVAARYVLRDAPEDNDAVDIVLNHSFPSDERRRLLRLPLRECRRSLRETPLDPPEITRFAALCEDCGDDALERASLGILCLTGLLADEHQERLNELNACCPKAPSGVWSESDFEILAAAGQLGEAGRVARLIAPCIAAEMEPSLEALGVEASMERPAEADDKLWQEIASWASAFGSSDFTLYVGGDDSGMVRLFMLTQPTLVLGEAVIHPLSPATRARIAAQLSTLRRRTSPLLNYDPQIISDWMSAAESVAGRELDLTPQVAELARVLAKALNNDQREELTTLSDALLRASLDLRNTPRAVALGAAKAAVLSHGDVSVLRELPELLPEKDEDRADMIAELIRFSLSDEYFAMRKKVGLEGA